jgi:hypothetical protein
MFTRKTFLITTALALLAAVNVVPADGIRNAGDKLRGDFGDRPAATMYRSQPMYRAVAPTATRSFSYEPAQQPAAAAPCPAAATPAPAPQAQGQRSAPAQRRFTYEPSYQSAPVMSRRGAPRVPTYMLPKTDSRRYGGF